MHEVFSGMKCDIVLEGDQLGLVKTKQSIRGAGGLAIRNMV